MSLRNVNKAATAAGLRLQQASFHTGDGRGAERRLRRMSEFADKYYLTKRRNTDRIIVENKKIRYDFEVKRNITIIKGDSATGKTTLADN